MQAATRWARPVLAIAIAALLAFGTAVAVFISRPSVILIPWGGGPIPAGSPLPQWHLCRLPPGAVLPEGSMSWRGGEAGCVGERREGSDPGHDLRLRVTPGIYEVTVGTKDCWSEEVFNVRAHRVGKRMMAKSMSCPIQ